MDTTPGARHSLADCLAEWSLSHAEDAALTFVDHRGSPDGLAVTLSWSALHRRVSATAAWLQRVARAGQRAVLLAPQGLDYVVAFLATLRARVVAVPLAVEDVLDNREYLAEVFADCTPNWVLTTGPLLTEMRDFLDEQRLTDTVQTIAVDAVPEALAADCRPVHVHPEDIAYLRYTVDALGAPAGVVISHGNLVAGGLRAVEACGAVPGRTVSVTWQPLSRDLGLIMAVVAPLTARLRVVLLDPGAVLEQPRRWLQVLSATQGAITAAPDFALAYCASRVSEQDRVWMRLGQVAALVNGGEPIRPDTVRAALDVFGECGLLPQALRACYGSPESAGPVSITAAGAPPRQLTVDRELLAAGKAVPRTGSDHRSTTLVSSGVPVRGELLVVDPDLRWPLSDDLVGEIWVSGATVARGHWGRDAAEQDVFGAKLDDPVLGTESWLRTGDLGFRHEGELYVIGRQEDLLTVNGRHLDPREVELTARAAHSALRPDGLVAVSVPTPRGDAVTVFAERSQHVSPKDLDLGAITEAVRCAVTARFGVAVDQVLVLEPGRIPFTSAGRVARSVCRQRYLDGTL
ncbi:fatty acyl-AMP ligase [Kutzneria albida]|uniref:AMP-dependent synthetase/ligase domain-containing protein n=1 Tax=Kutzneria albida DSM 43870 TaxID=1449976 RepID=W5WET3_9PSEU|nr:fatty acyl-AMP ligase [Kutzneria albida]AHH99708.1 hypothetical protein KALB_6348 [Kutzneria albida DSM 43870]